MIHRFSFVLVAATGLISSEIQAAQDKQPGSVGQAVVEQSDALSSVGLPLELVAFCEDPQELDQMGVAMETVGDYLFVGAPGDGDGRVDVWYRGPHGYAFVQRLGILRLADE